MFIRPLTSDFVGIGCGRELATSLQRSSAVSGKIQ
jgi:hypothetical protein